MIERRARTHGSGERKDGYHPQGPTRLNLFLLPWPRLLGQHPSGSRDTDETDFLGRLHHVHQHDQAGQSHDDRQAQLDGDRVIVRDFRQRPPPVRHLEQTIFLAGETTDQAAENERKQTAENRQQESQNEGRAGAKGSQLSQGQKHEPSETQIE